MPAYNFKSRFVAPILKGEKCTTIRRRRKRPTRPGDFLSLYTGMRTKQCALIARAKCARVTPIVIRPDLCTLSVVADDGAEILLEPDEVVEIARDDGFEDALEFFDFFLQTYGDESAYLVELDDFDVIEWDAETLIPGGRAI